MIRDSANTQFVRTMGNVEVSFFVVKKEKTYMKKFKKTAKQGLDGCNIEITLNGMYGEISIKDRPLISLLGTPYGSIKCANGVAKVSFNFPKFIHEDNVNPFRPTSELTVRMLKGSLEEQLKGIFGDIELNKLKSIEVNITQKVCGSQTCEQVNHVLRLLNASMLSKRADKQNKLFVNASKDNNHKMCVTGTVSHSVNGRYVVKCYNKHFHALREGVTDCKVTEGLLRIEIIMQKRTLVKLFQDKLSISDILQIESLIAIMNEYKNIYINEILNGYVAHCVEASADKIFEELQKATTAHFITETIAKNKEIIYDVEILRKGLKKYYKLKNMPDNSRVIVYKLAKKYGIPTDVIATLEEFAKSCG